MEKNSLLENLPLFFMVGLFAIMLIPQVPAEIKGPLVWGGLILVIPLTIVVEKAAQYAAASNIVIKAFIYGWDIEKEFHCKKPVGPLTSSFNPITQTYTETWELIQKTTLPIFGDIPVDQISIEHTGHWNQRCTPKKHYVHYRGIRVEHPNTYCITLHPQRRAPIINRVLQINPKFTLSEGNMDIYTKKDRINDAYIGVIPQ